MKHLKDILLEAEEIPASNVAPPTAEGEKEKPETSLFKYQVNKEKQNGIMIYDKILEIVQLLQYDEHKEVEKFFDMNENSMVYLDEMNPGETHEDTNSILTKIW